MRRLPGCSIVDCHVHAFDIGLIAAERFDALNGIGKAMEACGYGAINVMSLTSYKQENMAQNPLCLLIKALYPGKTYAFGSLYYPPEGFMGGEPDFREQAQRLIAAGCDGMKMMEGKPDTRKRTGLPLDSAAYDGYYAWLQAERLPLLYHVGDPPSFWDRDKVPDWALENGWFYGDGTYVSRDELFAEADGILRKFPLLNMIFAHFHSKSGDVEAAAAYLDKWPNVRFDITPGSAMYGDFSRDTGAWREFFIRYQDRILYGTDDEVEAPRQWPATAGNIRRFLETDDEFTGFRGQTTRGICLPEQVLDKIYRGNFESLAGSTPKSVDLRAATDECELLLGVVPEIPQKQTVISQFTAVMDRLKTL